MGEIPKTFLVYSKYPAVAIESLLSLSNPEQLKDSISETMNMKRGSIKEDILVDFYYNLFVFAKHQSFSVDKTSCLIEIFEFLLEKVQSGQVQNNSSFEMFKQLLLKHSIQRSPYSISIFTLNDVKALTDFALLTFYRHYSLYEYIFNPKKDVVLSSVNKFEGVFPLVLGLMDAQEENPENIPLLDAFIEKPPDEAPEANEELPSEKKSETAEEDQDPDDPVQKYLAQQMELLKQEMDTLMYAQDQDFNAKLEQLKK